MGNSVEDAGLIRGLLRSVRLALRGRACSVRGCGRRATRMLDVFAIGDSVPGRDSWRVRSAVVRLELCRRCFSEFGRQCPLEIAELADLLGEWHRRARAACSDSETVH